MHALMHALTVFLNVESYPNLRNSQRALPEGGVSLDPSFHLSLVKESGAVNTIFGEGTR